MNITYPPLLAYWLTWQWWLYSFIITTTLKSAVLTPYLYKKRATDGAVVVDRNVYTLCFAGWLADARAAKGWGVSPLERNARASNRDVESPFF